MQERFKDFFISYTKTDRPWAEWIAWQLEAAGYAVVIQVWDFLADPNFVLEMRKAATRAEHMIVVLSPDYLHALSIQPEWSTAFVQDPKSADGTPLPVRVRACKLPVSLAAIPFVDLVGVNIEEVAQETLLKEARRKQVEPTTDPAIPTKSDHPQDTPRKPPCFPGALPALWNVPYQHNMFFTGREDILDQIYDTLMAKQTAALTQPQAISGPGGIGKTQTAVEYAYRYYQDYQAVLWVRADSQEAWISDLMSLAVLLNLPERGKANADHIIQAVKHWFQTHSGWLLIFDNVNDLAQLEPIIPAGTGHVLLTTCTTDTEPIARSIPLPTMPEHEGALFLLRRTKRLLPHASLAQADEADRTTALSITRTLNGLPLALDQAGAYILETQCDLPAYLDHYQQCGSDLLGREDRCAQGYSDPVAITWALSFEKLIQRCPAAALILQICAFLYPEAIAEELFTVAVPRLNPPQVVKNQSELDEAIAVLEAYSLTQYEAGIRTFSLHRLVQQVLRDDMTQEQQQQWLERVVLTLNDLFPANHEQFATWEQCERYLLHIQSAATFLDRFSNTLPEAPALLNRTVGYLNARGRYIEATTFAQRALTICEQALGPNHPDTAQSLNNLALLYARQGDYTKAEPLLQQALTLCEQVLGPTHPNTATSLSNLALLYARQGHYIQAEPLYQRALAIREQVLGPNHPNIATNLDNLALLYARQGRYTQAEPLYQRALSIRKQVLGPNHPDTTQSLDTLAGFYASQGDYTKAEPLLLRALSIREQVLGPSHPNTATSLNNLAGLYVRQGDYIKAEPLYQHALSIREQVLGPNHPDTTQSLDNMALLYAQQGDYIKAELLYQRALSIREQVLGPGHPDTATSLNNLAGLYVRQGDSAQAEPLLLRALSIREQVLGPNHPDTAQSLNNLASLYARQGDYAKAEPLYQHALTIHEQVLGPNHPDTVIIRKNYTALPQQQHRYTWWTRVRRLLHI